jgi:acyl-CoA synthetase (AMP-forming)/AMP-acid ligase II
VAADTTAGLILFGGARTSDMVCPIRLDAPLLLARCEQAARQHAFGPTTRLFSALGPANPLALEAVLATWWAGGAVAFALAGETTGVTLARVKPDRVLIAPPLLPGLLTAAGAQAVAGCAQRRLLVAGGPLPLQLARQASRVLAADVRLLLSAPESSLFSIGALQDLETGPGCVGQLVEGAQALAVDAAGNPCNVGEVGALRIRSPLMTDQYLAQPGGAQGALHEGWFVTGLRGHVTAADQRLIITGAEPVAARPAASRERAVQRILTRGEMEAAIGKLPGVDEACVLSLPLPDRRSLPVVVYSSKSGADMKELSTRIGILTLGQTAFHLIRMPALPRDGKGLVLRDQLARQVGAALGALQSGKAKAAGA